MKVGRPVCTSELYFFSSGTLFKQINKPLLEWLQADMKNRVGYLTKLNDPDEDSELFRILAECIFNFIKYKKQPFPSAMLSQEDFWNVEVWKRYIIFIYLYRITLDQHVTCKYYEWTEDLFKLTRSLFNRPVYITCNSHITRMRLTYKSHATRMWLRYNSHVTGGWKRTSRSWNSPKIYKNWTSSNWSKPAGVGARNRSCRPHRRLHIKRGGTTLISPWTRTVISPWFFLRCFCFVIFKVTRIFFLIIWYIYNYETDI